MLPNFSNMNNIISVNAEEFLKHSTAPIFMVILTTPNGTFLYTHDGFQNTNDEKGKDAAFERSELVGTYGKAILKAGEFFPEGRLEIVELPIMP